MFEGDSGSNRINVSSIIEGRFADFYISLTNKIIAASSILIGYRHATPASDKCQLVGIPAVKSNPPTTTRELAYVVPSIAASDGAGVKLRRSLGSGRDQRHDPFLMLDEFFSDDPDDYIAGFPSHPHRGFETITYMLDGHMLHEDSHGNHGDLGPGDAQWMTAASGIIHSEMPQQAAGRLRGFQLWLNLPAAEKMPE